MRTTNIRFNGLASGLDTESMVKAMVMPYKNNVDKATQEQKLLELRKDAWKDMNSKIYKFYNETLSKLRLGGTFNNKQTTVSTPGLIEIGNKGSFPDGTHKVTVKNLAEGAVLNSTNMTAVRKENILDADGNVIGQKEVGVTGDTKLTDLIQQTKDAQGNVTSETNVFKVGNEIRFNVNGEEKTLSIEDGTTVSDLVEEMQEAGLNASFDEKNQAFFVSTKETGGEQKFSLKVMDGNTDISQNALSALGINKQDGAADYTFTGKDAKITYNGVEVKSSTNVVSVNGMEIKLLSADPNKEIMVVSKVDTEATVENIKSFVEEYNKLIDEMNTKINASYNKDYKPLTDEQKKDMSEEDIKLWNEKVEASLLRKDPVLQAITSSMRSIISDTTVSVGGKQYSLASFGITTSANYKEGGKLTIDEEKLRETMNQAPGVIEQLFSNKVDAKTLLEPPATWETATEEQKKQAEQNALKQSGIGVRLYADISERLKGTTLKSSNFLFNDKEIDKKISSQKEEVDKLQEKMYRMEDMYYKQFAAMEKMLGQLNNQSNWLMSQLGGM